MRDKKKLYQRQKEYRQRKRQRSADYESFYNLAVQDPTQTVKNVLETFGIKIQTQKKGKKKP
jgi:hypothetical protein